MTETPGMDMSILVAGFDLPVTESMNPERRTDLILVRVGRLLVVACPTVAHMSVRAIQHAAFISTESYLSLNGGVLWLPGREPIGEGLERSSAVRLALTQDAARRWVACIRGELQEHGREFEQLSRVTIVETDVPETRTPF